MPAVRGLLTGVTDCGRADLLKAGKPRDGVAVAGLSVSARERRQPPRCANRGKLPRDD